MNIETTEHIIWIVVGVLATIQLLYTFIVYHALHRRTVAEKKGKTDVADKQPGISVVIATADCEELLAKHLPLILEQDYPDFEVIVVDDNSGDDTKDLLQRLARKYPHLYSTFTSDSIRYISHKKLALMLGIKAAKKEWLVFTEPDCYPTSNQWLARMARNFTDDTDVVLGYSNYERKPGFANRCYMFDTLIQQLRLLGLTLNKRGYMGIGRNLAYRREIFFANKGYSRHLDLERGEDDLFISEHVPSNRITAEVSPQSVVRCTSTNAYTWQADKLSRLFIRGKMHRMVSHLFALDIPSILLLHIVAIDGIVFSIMQHRWVSLAITAIAWIIGFGSRIYVLHRASRNLEERRYHLSLPLMELLYPCWEIFFRLRLALSSKRAHLRRKV